MPEDAPFPPLNFEFRFSSSTRTKPADYEKICNEQLVNSSTVQCEGAKVNNSQTCLPLLVLSLLFGARTTLFSSSLIVSTMRNSVFLWSRFAIKSLATDAEAFVRCCVCRRCSFCIDGRRSASHSWTLVLRRSASILEMGQWDWRWQSTMDMVAAAVSDRLLGAGCVPPLHMLVLQSKYV